MVSGEEVKTRATLCIKPFATVFSINCSTLSACIFFHASYSSPRFPTLLSSHLRTHAKGIGTIMTIVAAYLESVASGCVMHIRHCGHFSGGQMLSDQPFPEAVT